MLPRPWNPPSQKKLKTTFTYFGQCAYIVLVVWLVCVAMYTQVTQVKAYTDVIILISCSYCFAISWHLLAESLLGSGNMFFSLLHYRLDSWLSVWLECGLQMVPGPSARFLTVCESTTGTLPVSPTDKLQWFTSKCPVWLRLAIYKFQVEPHSIEATYVGPVDVLLVGLDVHLAATFAAPWMAVCAAEHKSRSGLVST